MAERRAWSTGDQVAIARVTVCAHCKTGDGTYRCGRCNLVCYCSTECQKAAWKTHKMMCITALGRVNPGGSAATDWQELRMVFDTPLVKVSEAPFHSPPVETKEAVLDAFVCFVAWLQVLPAVYSDESDAAKLLQQLTVAADLETFLCAPRRDWRGAVGVGLERTGGRYDRRLHRGARSNVEYSPNVRMPDLHGPHSAGMWARTLLAIAVRSQAAHDLSRTVHRELEPAPLPDLQL